MFKTIMPLNAIIAARFFGLFLVLPVISIYAMNMPGATNTLVGIVIGGYAITQMIFQVPFGIMSDKMGRKGTIILGLLLFGIGSIIAAVADDLLMLLLGRFLQGAGAIGAVVTAMISDVIKEEQRPKAMAMMGGSIAVSFALAMVLGPVIGAGAGVDTLFYIVAFLAFGSIYVLVKYVPDPPSITHTYNGKDKYAFLANPDLIKMNITNFLQKGLMTFAFMIIPIVLIKTYGWEMAELWKIYLPAMIAGIFAMGPAAILAEKKGMFKQVLVLGIVFFGIAYYIIGISDTYTMFAVGVIVFFIGFNMHEPIMQSLASKYAKIHQKGAVLGVFNSFGYLGTFIGGFVGGVYLDQMPLERIAFAILIICILWALLILTLPNPTKTKVAYINIDETSQDKYKSLDDKPGFVEWYINNTENIVIIKYYTEFYNEDEIKELIKK
ncbi:MAG TPA: MFS transporter [Arcobacter sp.]|nr:MFS transporter [Arcobacter sp.]